MLSDPVRQSRNIFAAVAHNELTAWVVLVLSLLLTALAWQISTQYVERRAQERFQYEVEDAKFAIGKRMLDYEQMLRAGVALFNAVEHPVTRREWRAFVSTLNIEESFPGLQGIGYSRWISPQDLDAVISEVRAEGYPEFAIKPEGEREFYSSIIYLEPMDDRNLRAFGYDMFSEPTRRAAMEHARDADQTSVSGRVVLLQETEQDVQAGFLMYLPVYRAGADIATIEQRRAALLGFVYSPFRMRDLMQGILGFGKPELEFKLYDGIEAQADKLLFDTLQAWGDVSEKSVQSAAYTSKQVIDLPGRTWSAIFTGSKKFEAEMSSSQPLQIVVGGVVVDFLLFAIIWSLSQQRKRVVVKAREMTSELRRSREQFRAITDAAHDAIISTEVNGAILYSNPAASSVFGLSADDLIGMPVTALLTEGGGPKQGPGLPALMKEGRFAAVSATFEAQGIRADDSEFPLEVSVSNWKAEDEIFFTLLIRDISERKRIDRLKDEFISTVSHELRTPLTAIRGALGLLRTTEKNNAPIPQSADLLSIACQNTERLVHLVNDILDLERLESGRLVLDLQQLNLPELLKQAIRENQPYALPHDVALVLAEPIPNISLQADSGRLMQVLANFISNAIKFSETGASVTVSAVLKDGKVRVSVTDAGIGVPEDFRERLFMRFTQADATDSRRKGGSGLGLSISKSIIDLHKGAIGYDTEEGKGSCFYFELAVAQPGSEQSSI
ncbi:MAG: CHASE domain-containing protein [Gammaproteobacteria bacterium]|nr:CHASE domain-containing protein [Gammaproteobacteria bacterium]